MPALAPDGNYQRRGVSFITAMSMLAFKRGFKDARSGLPFDSDYVDKAKASSAFMYERGRMFGCLHPGVVLTDKKGNITWDARNLYKQAREAGDIA